MDIEQRSDDWFNARLGKPTASRMGDVMARTKTGFGASRENYMMDLLCERLTGVKQGGYLNAAMQRGIDMEPFARQEYVLQTGNDVTEVGFIEMDGYGASPDGLVNDDGLIEIKCPNTLAHTNFLLTCNIERKYILQMQTQMICTGRKWCDFVSYDDRLPPPLHYKCVRVGADLELHEEIKNEVALFIAELNDLESRLRELAHE